jgi:hypothetical protein
VAPVLTAVLQVTIDEKMNAQGSDIVRHYPTSILPIDGLSKMLYLQVLAAPRRGRLDRSGCWPFMTDILDAYSVLIS